MASLFFIYGLFDPRDGELRYIGKTEKALGVRLSGHLCAANQGKNTHLFNWIRLLRTMGEKPYISQIQVLNEVEDLNRAEVYWIAFFRAQGCRLTNSTDGGEGTSGHRKLSLEEANMVPIFYRQGLSSSRIASRLGVSERTVLDTLRGLGATLRGPGRYDKLTPQQAAEVVACYKQGLSSIKIARQIGVADDIVLRVLERAGVGRRDLRSYFKLTPKQVLEVSALSAQGLSSRKIGIRFGVNHLTVLKALKRAKEY